MAFLHNLAEKYMREEGKNIHHVAFVFPTRRAGLYFQRRLKTLNAAGSVFWAPRTYSMDDFLALLSGLPASDHLDLVFSLFRIYKRYVRHFPRNFEDFYPWGKMLLADFDEMDKYLIDAERLFTVLREFKATEDITKDEKAEIYNRYTGFWQDLSVLYREFREMLRKSGKGYEGMLFREVAEGIGATVEKIKAGAFRQPWRRVVFAGFNAMTKAEETIIGRLLKEGMAEIFWDMDHYFADDAVQEAGRFFRRNTAIFHQSDPLWVEDRLAEPKNITLIGVQSGVSQAKVLGYKLKNLASNPSDPEHTAVVLPDNTLLFPVLNSMPEQVGRINVTIGFPLQQTPVFSLFSIIMEMHIRLLENKGPGFYYRDVSRVLNHPYIKPLDPEGVTAFLDKIVRENIVYVRQEDIPKGKEAMEKLFVSRGDSTGITAFFMELTEYIREYYEEENPELSMVDYEYLYHFHTLISRLKDSLEAAGLVLSLRTFMQLFTDIVQSGRIPFTGEPLEGLQIMGVLETQTLDFQNLFVLSVNEGHLPPGKSQQSFIPFDVRLILGLPTYKDRDAITAYHFYRLLKNSRNITLLYTTESKGMEHSEKSRFIDQLLIEYAERNKRAVIEHYILDFQFDSQKVKHISIPKSQGMLESLEKKAFSPSSLLNYLGCPLRFYFTYVLRLFEENEIYESPDFKLIGQIVHRTLEQLYKPCLESGLEVTVEMINGMEVRLEGALRNAFHQEMKEADIASGRNYIIWRVLRRFLENFLEKERKQPGFRVLMLEQKLEGVYLPVQAGKRNWDIRLKGTIDRLDIRGGAHRVLDYKTGRPWGLKLDSLEVFSSSEAVKYKEAFQLFFYRYLLQRLNPLGEAFQLGVYRFKKLNDRLEFVSLDGKDILETGVLSEFEDILTGILGRLFDIGDPFVQTEDETQCRHCPYVNICGREPVEDFGG